jgi:hypothetical protein
MLTINITASNILNVLKRYVSAFFRPGGVLMIQIYKNHALPRSYDHGHFMAFRGCTGSGYGRLAGNSSGQ